MHPEPIVMDGRALSARVNAGTRAGIEALERQPCLAIVQVGHTPAADSHVAMQLKDCADVGIQPMHVVLPVDVRPDEAVRTVSALNADPVVDAVIVERPLPLQVSLDRMADAMDPSKDVDGMSPRNAGLLASGRTGGFVPCTPAGVMALLDEYGIELAGKNALVLGRSPVVGRPMAQLLLMRDATPVVCHSKTDHSYLIHQVMCADIVIAAMGDPSELANSCDTMGALSGGKILVNVAVNVGEDGKILGDVPSGWTRTCRAYTPVPGGVGPMSRAMLLRNVLESARRRHGE